MKLCCPLKSVGLLSLLGYKTKKKSVCSFGLFQHKKNKSVKIFQITFPFNTSIHV